MKQTWYRRAPGLRQRRLKGLKVSVGISWPQIFCTFRHPEIRDGKLHQLPAGDFSRRLPTCLYPDVSVSNGISARLATSLASCSRRTFTTTRCEAPTVQLAGQQPDLSWLAFASVHQVKDAAKDPNSMTVEMDLSICWILENQASGHWQALRAR